MSFDAFKILVALGGSGVGVTNGTVHPKNVSTLNPTRTRVMLFSPTVLPSRL